MAYTKEELKEYLQEYFIENDWAFTAGRRNNDVVDSMCICFALDEEWTEMYAKHADNYPEHSEPYYSRYVKDHYERVKKWLDDKEANGYNRGEMNIMNFTIDVERK